MAKKKLPANVEKLPNGTYRWRLNVNGFKDTSKGRTYYDPHQCSLDAQNAKKLMKLGVYRAAGSSHAEMNFHSYAESYIDTPSGSGRGLAPTTRAKYRSYLRLHLTEFSSRPLNAITAAQVRGWNGLLQAQHPTTSARVYAFFSAVMKRAVVDELIDKSPCRLKGARQASSGVTKYFPSDEDIQRLATHMNPRFKVLVTFAALTGLRVGELRALRLKNLRKVDRDGNYYYIVDVTGSVNNIDGQVVEGPPKSKKGLRSNTLPSKYTAYLDLYIASIPHEQGDYLFPSNDGTKPFDPGVLANNWKRAKARAGITVEHFTPHCLRHYAATHYLRNVSNDIPNLKAFLGDSSDKAVFGYLHAVKADQGNKEPDINIANILPLPPAN